MRKTGLLFLLLLSLCLVLVSGCVEVEHRLEVREDGSAFLDYRMVTPVDEDLGPDDDELEELTEDGYTVKHEVKDEQSVVSISREFSSIEELTLQDIRAVNEDAGPALENEPVFKVEGNKYILQIPHILNDGDMDQESLAMLDSVIDYKFILTLPAEPIEHNAGSVSEDGKTLTWDLVELKLEDSITAEFRLSSGGFFSSPVFYGIIGLAVLIAAALVVTKNKKHKNQPES